MKFYWIDALNEYEYSVTEGVIKVFEAVYEPYAKKNGFEFEYLDAAKILPVSSSSDMLLYDGRDVLKNKASVFISYTNASSQVEKILESITRMANESKTWVIANRTGKGIFLDKDKLAGISMARRLGVPVLPTVLIPSNKRSRMLVGDIESVLGPYPYILKPKEMLAGIGILKIDSAESFRSALDIVGQSSRDYIAQAFLKDAEDYRVYTEKGKIIACLRRQPVQGSYIASISRTGKGTSITPPDAIVRLTEKIASKLLSDYLCVDWLVSGDEFRFSEIESGGGFSALPEPEKSRVARAFFMSNRREGLK
ncbi:MAG: hypothetical protein AAB359_01555 [Elusimicrobiota bacterium]